MEMTDEWARSLDKNGIKFCEDRDYITFYDPHEYPGKVIVREHFKRGENSYKSQRTGYISFEEFEKLPKEVRYIKKLEIGMHDWDKWRQVFLEEPNGDCYYYKWDERGTVIYFKWMYSEYVPIAKFKPTNLDQPKRE